MRCLVPITSIVRNQSKRNVATQFMLSFYAVPDSRLQVSSPDIWVDLPTIIHLIKKIPHGIFMLSFISKVIIDTVRLAFNMNHHTKFNFIIGLLNI